MSIDVYALTAPALFASCGYLLAWGRQRRRDRIDFEQRLDEIAKRPPVTAPVMPQPTVFDQDWTDESLNRLLEAVKLAEPPRVIDQEPRWADPQPAWKLTIDGWVLDLTDGAS